MSDKSLCYKFRSLNINVSETERERGERELFFLPGCRKYSNLRDYNLMIL